MRGIRGFGSVLGHGIINGCLAVARSASEVVGVESGVVLAAVCLQNNFFFVGEENIAIG
jgi:hypothetical protein